MHAPDRSGESGMMAPSDKRFDIFMYENAKDDPRNVTNIAGKE